MKAYDLKMTGSAAPRKSDHAPVSGGGKTPPGRWFRVRAALLLVVLTCGALAVLYRAFEVQVLQSSELSAMAKAQQERELRVAPKRGSIRDTHGTALAVSVEAESVWANPRQLQAEGVNTYELANELANTFDVSPKTLLHRFKSKRYFVWVKRHVAPKKARELERRKVPGLHVTLEARRYYPNRQLASHLLGVANIDGKGIEGLELAFEDTLRGSNEVLPAVRDRSGRIVFSGGLSNHRATQGDDLVLSIDRTMQHIAERELSMAVRSVEAKSGSVVVVEPHTGDILALANYPSFNPNQFRASTADSRRNRAITDRFEPGSTIKPFTVAAALHHGVIGPRTRIYCEDGDMPVADAVIHDDHAFGRLSVTEILAHSSNIGTVKIAQALGRPRLYRALRAFGFGEDTGIPLNGESRGLLRHHRQWYEVDAATISFGQGLGVTSVQLAMATAALANGGWLMKPRLVKRVVGPDGEVRRYVPPRRRRRALDEKSVRIVAGMMTHVTEAGGTGVEAAISGYDVAGKTGTAQKADVRGGYAHDRRLASFVGFAPAGAPRFVMSVVIDEPVIDHYGGTVAAPVFRRVAAGILAHMGVPPDAPALAIDGKAFRNRWSIADRRLRGMRQGFGDTEGR